MIIDTQPCAKQIVQAACRLTYELLNEDYRDQMDPVENLERNVAAKKAEAAYALAYGHPVDRILRDRRGAPDFVTPIGVVDVKAHAPGRGVTIGADLLGRKPDDYRLVACQVWPSSWAVQITGQIHAWEIRHLPVTPPAPGHSRAFIRIPLDLLTPVTDEPALTGVIW